MADEQQTRKPTPPYVAYKTFKSAISGLEHVPDTIDYSVYQNMNGSTRSLLFGAFKFFELIGSDGKPSQEFRSLAEDGDDKWNDTIRTLIESHYAEQLPNLKSGSVASLKKSFGDDIGGSVVSPACRFLMQAAQEVGLPVSPSIAKRKFGSATPRTRRNGKKVKPPTPRGGDSGSGEMEDETPPGTVRFPIPIAGKKAGAIIVPEDLGEADLPMLQAMFAAVEQYAKQNAD